MSDETMKSLKQIFEIIDETIEIYEQSRTRSIDDHKLESDDYFRGAISALQFLKREFGYPKIRY